MYHGLRASTRIADQHHRHREEAEQGERVHRVTSPAFGGSQRDAHSAGSSITACETPTVAKTRGVRGERREQPVEHVLVAQPVGEAGDALRRQLVAHRIGLARGHRARRQRTAEDARVLAFDERPVDRELERRSDEAKKSLK
jgi:hypothetical protein